VGEEAAKDFLDFMDSNAAVDLHLADQIVPYLAMAEGKSSFTVQSITRHLLTNIWVVKHFLKRDIEVEGALGESGRITVV
jgi:RNA 3'-terminal phosphate cyclase